MLSPHNVLIFSLVAVLAAPAAPARQGDASPTWLAVDDFAYQLQNVDLAEIARSRFDLVVMDYSKEGGDDTRFTRDEILALKDAPDGPDFVLAYMSIGEAESYRWYWDRAWDANDDGRPDAGAPSWLGPENPDWKGNYKVRYWDPAWQAIVFDYARRIVDAGFDGVYLDIIDAYEYWGPGGDSGENRPTAEREMVDFVLAIATTARAASGREDFGVFPQNGEALGAHPDYLAAVTGIGREDLFFDGNRKVRPAWTAEAVRYLDLFRAAGRLVLVIDYVRKPRKIDVFYSKVLERGYVPYATVRPLDRLVVNGGHEPD